MSESADSGQLFLLFRSLFVFLEKELASGQQSVATSCENKEEKSFGTYYVLVAVDVLFPVPRRERLRGRLAPA